MVVVINVPALIVTAFSVFVFIVPDVINVVAFIVLAVIVPLPAFMLLF